MTGTSDSNEGRSDSATWSTYRGGPRRTGGQPAIGGPDGPVDRSWRLELGTSESARSYHGGAPVVDDENVYVGATHGSPTNPPQLRAVSRETGTVDWTADVHQGVAGSPTVADGAVYVGTKHDGDRFLAAFDSADSSRRWRVELPEQLRVSPTVADGRVYVTSASAESEGYVSAFDAADGAELWRTELPDRSKTAPAIGDDSLFVGCRDGSVYALSAGSGEVDWSYDTAEGVDRTFGVRDGRVCVSSRDDEYDSRVFVLDADSGDELWRSEAEAYAPILDDGSVYAAGAYGGLFALDVESGEKRWELDDSPGAQPCAVTADRLYTGATVANSDRLGAIDPTAGEVLWEIEPETPTISPPAIAEDGLFVLTEAALLAFAEN